MNNNNNMNNNTNNSSVDQFQNLKPNQQAFIQDLYKGICRDAEDGEVGLVILGSYSRQYLKMMTAKYCGMQWAPAWIVKNKARSNGSGGYDLPELLEYHEYTTLKPETTASLRIIDDQIIDEDFDAFEDVGGGDGPVVATSPSDEEMTETYS